MEYWSRDDVVADLDVVEHRRSFAGHTVYRVVLQVKKRPKYFLMINIREQRKAAGTLNKTVASKHISRNTLILVSF